MERRIVHRVGLKPVSAVSISVNQACPRWSFEGGTAPVIGAPYSASETVESVTTYRDGNRTVRGVTNRRLYRDSHGRTRVDAVFLPADSSDPVPIGITISDPVAGKQYSLQPQQKTFNVLPWRGESAINPPVATPIPSTNMSVEVGYFRGVPESECKAVSLGEQVVDGIKAVGTRVEHTIPIGAFRNQKPIDIRVEQWFSPELGVIIQTTRWSSIGTEAIHRLEQVVREEPDATLFTVPSDYKDVVAAALAAQGRTPAPVINPAYYLGPVDPSSLPVTRATPVLRVDFSDQAAWEAIRDEIQLPSPKIEGYSCVTFIDDRAYEGIPIDRLRAAVPEKYGHWFMFVVDAATVTTPDHPVLVIDLRTPARAGFRAVTSKVYDIECNLSLGNLGFDDFERAAAKTGVYRGS